MSFASRNMHSAQYTVRRLYLELLTEGKQASEVVPAILPSFSAFNIEVDNTVTITHIFDMAAYFNQTGFDMITGTWRIK